MLRLICCWRVSGSVPRQPTTRYAPARPLLYAISPGLNHDCWRGAQTALNAHSLHATPPAAQENAPDLRAGERNRTAALPFTRRPLCQLSYTGGARCIVAEQGPDVRPSPLTCGLGGILAVRYMHATDCSRTCRARTPACRCKRRLLCRLSYTPAEGAAHVGRAGRDRESLPASGTAIAVPDAGSSGRAGYRLRISACKVRSGQRHRLSNRAARQCARLTLHSSPCTQTGGITV